MVIFHSYISLPEGRPLIFFITNFQIIKPCHLDVQHWKWFQKLCLNVPIVGKLTHLLYLRMVGKPWKATHKFMLMFFLTLGLPRSDPDIYPLVNIQKAIEHGHRNSEFSHEK
jgi:hypothetical protein